jgi:hypothetical protein
VFDVKKRRRKRLALLRDIEATLVRALPFINPRADYADRAEASFSEVIRAALMKDEIEEILNRIRWES